MAYPVMIYYMMGYLILGGVRVFHIWGEGIYSSMLALTSFIRPFVGVTLIPLSGLMRVTPPIIRC